jgi:hypothetical protein
VLCLLPLITKCCCRRCCCCCWLQELEALWVSRIAGVLPDGECELLYGRAGYLYSLAWLQRELGPGTIRSALISVSSSWLGTCWAKSGLR